MNTRRGFFRRCAALVAAVAIAPEIAFRTRLALPEIEAQPYLVYACNESGIYEQLLHCGKLADLDPGHGSKLDLEELFRVSYEMKKQRQKAHLAEHYFMVQIDT